MKYTYLNLSEDVLKSAGRPMTAGEIWKEAEKLGLSQKLPSVGKTPQATVGAQIYVSIRDNPKSPFIQVSKRPAMFFLKGLNENPHLPSQLPETEEKSRPQFSERDLHPLLVRFARLNPHFKAHVKTIFHENSQKRMKGANEWLHPDLVGVYFPFQDYTKETIRLQKALNANSIKLFSFEMKIELNYSNLRKCFFQALSNSGWANEGYLVALKIDKDADFIGDLQRLSNAFGIGIIKLNADKLEESEIICSAAFKETIDWDTLNRLAEDSPDFTKFISDLKDDVDLNKVKSRYDKVLNDDEYLSYLEKMQISE